MRIIINKEIRVTLWYLRGIFVVSVGGILSLFLCLQSLVIMSL